MSINEVISQLEAMQAVRERLGEPESVTHCYIRALIEEVRRLQGLPELMEDRERKLCKAKQVIDVLKKGLGGLPNDHDEIDEILQQAHLIMERE